jgi:hypothetical protein
MKILQPTYKSAITLSFVLSACNFLDKSPEWHVGFCAAGVMQEINYQLSPVQIEKGLSISAKASGISADQVIQGFKAYQAKDDYTESCRIAREFEAKLRG